MPGLGGMPASRFWEECLLPGKTLPIKVFAIYHQMDLGFIKAATLTTRSKSRPQSWPRDLNYNRNYNQVLGWVNEEIICISIRCYLYNGKMSTGFGRDLPTFYMAELLTLWVAWSCDQAPPIWLAVSWASSWCLIGSQLELAPDWLSAWSLSLMVPGPRKWAWEIENASIWSISTILRQ